MNDSDTQTQEVTLKSDNVGLVDNIVEESTDNNSEPSPTIVNGDETPRISEEDNSVEAHKKYILKLETHLMNLHSQVFDSIQSLRKDPYSTLVKPTDPDADKTFLQQLIDHYDKNIITPKLYRKTENKRGKRSNYSTDDSSSDSSEDEDRPRQTKPTGRNSLLDDEGDTEITDVFDLDFWKKEVNRLLLKRRTARHRHFELPEEPDSLGSEEESTPRELTFSFVGPPNNQLSSPSPINKKRSVTDISTSSSIQTLSSEPPRKRAKKATAEKQVAWYQTPFDVVPKFAAFLGTEKVSRADAYKRVWQYIKEKSLQKDETDKKKIHVDETLKELLCPEDDIIPNIWTLNGLIKKLFIKQEKVVKKRRTKEKHTSPAASTSSNSPQTPLLQQQQQQNLEQNHSTVNTPKKNTSPSPVPLPKPSTMNNNNNNNIPLSPKNFTNITPTSYATTLQSKNQKFVTPGLSPNSMMGMHNSSLNTVQVKQQQQHVHTPHQMQQNWPNNLSLINFSSMLPNLHQPYMSQTSPILNKQPFQQPIQQPFQQQILQQQHVMPRQQLQVPTSSQLQHGTNHNDNSSHAQPFLDASK